MKLSVLALDYDGTIATDAGVERDVRAAIAQARTSGITVLLVTGRILSELRRVAGDLHFVDGVVAENGAVVHFPDSEHTSVLAPRVAPPLVSGFEAERLSFRAGECLVELLLVLDAALEELGDGDRGEAIAFDDLVDLFDGGG